MASALGSTETPTTDGVSASQLATTHANWIIKNKLKGLDIDYEDMGAMDRADGSAEAWLILYTQVSLSLKPTLLFSRY